jgi:uncharacterized protein
MSSTPPPLRLRRLPTEVVLGRSVAVAAVGRARLLGLAFLDREEAGPGLLIPRCRSVHTFGMRFPLDLIFLDEAGGVVELRRDVPPGRFIRCAEAIAVLEVPSPLP